MAKKEEIIETLRCYCNPITEWGKETIYEAYAYAKLDNIKSPREEQDKIEIALRFYQGKKKLRHFCNSFKIDG